ncbi:MAG: hypothetical protein LBU32_24520 [Clostridiales bacterium]|nr:hypothetical protein [Clostridiales bacterium]
MLILLITQIVIMLKGALIAFPGYYHNNIESLLSNIGTADGWPANLPPEWQEFLFNIQDSLADGLQNLVSMISRAGTSVLSGLWNGFPGFFIGLLFTVLLSFAIGTQYESVVGFIFDRIPDKLPKT